MSENLDRRQALKTIVVTIGGVATAITLPSSWTKPIVETIVVPAHAQASRLATTTVTPAPTRGIE